MDLAIGVDLGGSNLRVAAYRGLRALADETAARRGADGDRDGEPTLSVPVAVVAHREPVGEPRDPETVVGKIAAAVAAVADRAGAGSATVAVGVGIAAMLRDRAGTVANAPNLRWLDVPFGALLARALGKTRPLGVYNDVNAIAYGEGGLGAGAGARDVLAIYVGTGIGGGLVVDGRLVEGASNCAGEIGHVKVRWDAGAAPCACGGRGCVEAYLGGASMLRRIRGDLGGGVTSLATEIAGGVDQVTPGHVDQAAAAGDAWALALYAELAPLLGVTLANAVALINPSRLILGGGMLSRTPVLRDQVVAAMHALAPAALLEPLAVVDAVLGDDAGLVGSALLAAHGVSLIQL